MELDKLEANIETHNLTLEPILPSHAKKLFYYLQSKQLYYFIPLDPPKDIYYLEKKYLKWSNRKSIDGNEVWLNYAIYSKFYRRYVGTVQATLVASTDSYIAYEVFPEMWRKGIAKEACMALINFLFDKCELDKIKAHVDTRNIASYSLLESLGFYKIDLIYNADHFKGNSSDEFVYLLTRNCS